MTCDPFYPMEVFYLFAVNEKQKRLNSYFAWLVLLLGTFSSVKHFDLSEIFIRFHKVFTPDPFYSASPYINADFSLAWTFPRLALFSIIMNEAEWRYGHNERLCTF